MADKATRESSAIRVRGIAYNSTTTGGYGVSMRVAISQFQTSRIVASSTHTYVSVFESNKDIVVFYHIIGKLFQDFPDYHPVRHSFLRGLRR
jgi:hypothetical protein